MEYLDWIVTGLIASISSVVISEVYHRRSASISKKTIDKLRNDTDRFRDTVMNHIQSIDEDFSDESQMVLNIIQREIRALDTSFVSKRRENTILIILFVYFLVFAALSASVYFFTDIPFIAACLMASYFIIARLVYDYLRVSPIKKEIRSRYEKINEILHNYKISFSEKTSIEKWIVRNSFQFLDQEYMLKILTGVPIYTVAKQDKYDR